MATTVTKVIDPDSGAGYDYTSLSLWEAGQQGDLTGVRDEIAVAKCRCTAGTADTTAVVVDGWTTSATQYVKIWTDPSETYRHSGNLPTGNKYRLDVDLTADQAIIDVVENYVKIIGIAFNVSGSFTTENSVFGIITSYNSATSETLIESCVFTEDCSGERNNDVYGVCLRYDARSNAKIINSIFYDFTPSAYVYCIANTSWTSGYGLAWVYNCTFHTVSRYSSYNACAIYNSGDVGDMVVKNSLFQGCYEDVATGGAGATDTYCSTSNDNTKGLSSGGTGNRFSQTFSFVGASDFHLQANDTGALGYGLNLYNDATYPFQTDIDGHDRGGSGASWDIGADEYVAAGGTSIVPLILYHYRIRK